MIVEGKKIYFIIEHEFDDVATKLAKKFDMMPDAVSQSNYFWHNNYSYWHWNALFGIDSRGLWDFLEKKLNMTYIKASGPKGCHVFDFNTESARLAFQLKYGDVISG
jgi:hypothetical protein